MGIIGTILLLIILSPVIMFLLWLLGVWIEASSPVKK